MKGSVKQIAVDNFLDTIDLSLTEYESILNAQIDCNSYKWNMPTYRAIVSGIKKRYKEAGLR